MNALFVGDLHGHEWTRFARPDPDGVNSRFRDLLGVFDQVDAYLDRYQPDDVVQLGDVVHRRHFIRFRLFNRLVERLVGWRDRAAQLTIVKGNHDEEDQEGAHALDVLRHIDGVDVFDQPGQYVMASTHVTVLPFTTNQDLLSRTIEQAPADLPVIGHYAAEGVALESDYWLPSVLKLGELTRFPLTVFGHIHKPSRKGPVQPDARHRPEDGYGPLGQVLYPGAVMHYDFGDAGPRWCVLVQGSVITWLPLTAPMFATAKWPKVPVCSSPVGYLRLLEVPVAQTAAAREAARSAGWAEVFLPPPGLAHTVQQAVASGLQLTDGLLQEWIARRYPDLTPEDRQELVDDGLRYLRGGRLVA